MPKYWLHSTALCWHKVVFVKNFKSKFVSYGLAAHIITVLPIRTGYLPGEQTLITYTINGSYLVNADDSIILRKCGSTMSDMFNPYQWPAATTPHSSNVYRIRVGLPVSYQLVMMSIYFLGLK